VSIPFSGQIRELRLLEAEGLSTGAQKYFLLHKIRQFIEIAGILVQNTCYQQLARKIFIRMELQVHFARDCGAVANNFPFTLCLFSMSWEEIVRMSLIYKIVIVSMSAARSYICSFLQRPAFQDQAVNRPRGELPPNIFLFSKTIHGAQTGLPRSCSMPAQLRATDELTATNSAPMG
jgi:hypothetical protein